MISAREKEKARGEEKIKFFETVTRPPVLKPLLLINAFNLLQILSGSYVVIFYAVDIVKDSGGSLQPTVSMPPLYGILIITMTFRSDCMFCCELRQYQYLRHSQITYLLP